MVDTPISNLPGAGSVLGPMQFEVNDAGVSRSVTATQLNNFVSGTSGDNVTIVPHSAGNTTAAIQAAIDAVAAAGGGTVRLEAGQVYEVADAGSAQVRTVTPIQYCLVMKSGVRFDGNGSTIRLQNNQNAFPIINEGITTNVGAGPTQRDSDIWMVNLIIDGNKANQSASASLPTFEETGGMIFQSCDKCVFLNIEIRDTQCYGGRFLDMEDCMFNELRGFDVRGDCWSFGLPVNGPALENFRCTYDNIVSIRCAGGYDFPGSGRSTIQGNSMIGDFIECAGGLFLSRNCGGGVKIQGTSRDSTFGEFMWSGEVKGGEADNNTLNSGIKLQGDNNRINRVTIGRIVSTECQAEALRMTECDYSEVGSLISINNSKNASGNDDVRIEGRGNKLGNVHIQNNGGSTGIIFADDASVTQIGSITSIGLSGDLLEVNVANATLSVANVAMLDGGTSIVDHNSSGCTTLLGNVVTTSNAGDGTLFVENGGQITRQVVVKGVS